MALIDVHCHLDMIAERVNEQEMNNLMQKLEKQMKLVITSGVNPKSNRQALDFSKKYSFVKASFGIYPIDALASEIKVNLTRDIEPFDIDEELKWIANHKKECIAIGEIGLDYKLSPETANLQKKNFIKILNFAKKINKPVVIHSRKAEADAIKILKELDMKKVILHCFSGKKSLIKEAVNNKWYFTVPAIIKKLDHFKMLVNLVPIEQLLTETDSPFLSPNPNSVNDPTSVKISIEEIAKIKSLLTNYVENKIFENARKLFGITSI